MAIAALGVLFTSGLAPATLQAPAATTRQEWQLDQLIGRTIELGRAEPGETLVVNLVRADVILEDAPNGIVGLELQDKGVTPDFARVALRITSSPQFMSVIDIYPRRSAFWSSECLPPSDDRGDYWALYVHPSIVLKVPTSTKVTVNIKDGTIDDRRKGMSRSRVE